MANIKRNILQNNGYYDLVVTYQPVEPDTVYARYNLWDHETLDDILTYDVLVEGGENLVIDIDDFITFPAIPDLISPANNSTEVALNPELSWQQTAIPDYYHLQVAYDENFANLVIDTAELKETAFLITLEPETGYYWRVRAENPAGESDWSETWKFTTGMSGIGEKGKASFSFEIYPNPASDFISFQSVVGSWQSVVVEIYDLNGKKIIEKQIPAGTETFELDVRHLKSGVYFCTVRTQEHTLTKKLILQK